MIAELPKAEHVAPFACWPIKFDVSGRCRRCRQHGWLDFLVVFRPGMTAPRVYYGLGAYCEDCMIVLGVGTDAR